MTTPGLIGAFGAGVISFLSPCVLPLVPGYLSLVSGISVDEVESPVAAQRRTLILNVVLFVIGFSLVFISYGAVASSLGSTLNRHNKVLEQISGVLIIVMGLTVAGVFSLAPLMRERRFFVSPARLGPYAAPVMGMAFAFGWTPCIGPILAAVLTLAAARNTLGQGVSLLAAYSLGLGVPFVAMGFGFGRFRAGWTWFKRHGRAVDQVSGLLLVVFGILMLTSELTRLSSGVTWLWTQIGIDRLTLG